MAPSWTTVEGVIVAGHGIASGKSGDPRFPGGSINLQSPHFRAAGLDLSGYHSGTLNLSIAPKRFEVRQEAAFTIRQLTWLSGYPPEDFSFYHCRLTPPGGATVGALVYYPHPDTKPEFHQDESVLEVLAPWIEGLAQGDTVTLCLRDDEIKIL